MRKLHAALWLAGAAIVGCGASGNDGFDDSDSGSHEWPNGNGHDAGSSGPLGGEPGGSLGDGGGSGTPSDAGSGKSDASASSDSGTSGGGSDASATTTGAPCQVAPAGGFVGGPSESTTFTGTATETSPLAGSPQPFTLTITGSGEADCWNYDRCNAYVDMSTNLWASIGTIASGDSSFSAGVDGAVMHVIGDEGDGEFILRAKPRSTHFIGTYSSSGVVYSVTVDAPSSIAACSAVPNCSFAGTTGNYCGLSIDGYNDTIYHCFGSNPATVVQTCANMCVATSTGGIACD